MEKIVYSRFKGLDNVIATNEKSVIEQFED